MTPRYWGDETTGAQRWSTERLRQERLRESERRAWFVLWATFAGALVVLVILFGLSR